MDKYECDKITEMLPEYLNHTLSGPETARVLSHLAQCETCRKETAFLLSVQKACESFAADVPKEIACSVFKKVSEAQGTETQEEVLTVAKAFEFIRNAFSASRNTLSVSQKVIKLAYQSL
jgi:predicted anti-sigma-YlaC factor YlaD